MQPWIYICYTDKSMHTTPHKFSYNVILFEATYGVGVHVCLAAVTDLLPALLAESADTILILYYLLY